MKFLFTLVAEIIRLVNMAPFQLKLKNASKAKDRVNRQRIDVRNKQLDAAVQWCKEHDC